MTRKVAIQWMMIASTLLISLNLQAQEPYVVGIVPQFEVRKIKAIWNPILVELERKTGLKFVLQGSSTIPNFEKEFNAGEFDFSYMNPYHIMLANKNQGYIPLVRDVGRELYGILAVSKNSQIKTIKDLQDEVIAFPAPNALGASMLVRSDLRNKFKIDFEPKYVNSHSSVYLSVALGQAAAGGGVQKTLNRQVDNIKKQLRVIHKTKGFSPHPIAAHPRVSKKDRELVKKALLELGQESNGIDLLNDIPMKKIGVTSIEDYLPLKKLGLEKFYETP